MELIKPAEISAKIMTLIDDAETELIIVSPYNQITNWDKLINRIKKAKNKGIKITWYSRGNHTDINNVKEVKSNLGIDPILIDDLHAKIYLNEKSAIFTSMNMSKVSDDKSIDLGYITQNQKEYDELFDIFRRHISSSASKNVESEVIVKEIKHHALEVKFDKLYFNEIHKHVQSKYGSFKFDYSNGIDYDDLDNLDFSSIENLEDEYLEYSDFLFESVKIKFLIYSQAIRIHINLPYPKSSEKLYDQCLHDYTLKKINIREFNFVESDIENYIKYYYEVRYRKVQKWTKKDMENFLAEFDVLIQLLRKYY